MDAGMQKFDLTLIGHFAIDTIILRELKSVSQSLGGGVTYGSLAAEAFETKGHYEIVSKVGKDFDRKFLEIFNNHNIDTSKIIFTNGSSTRFTLDYHDGTRDLKSDGRAEKFGIEDITDSLFNTNAIHFTPIANEYTDEFICGMIEKCERNDMIFGLDVQGLIRGFREDGTIYMKKDDETQQRILRIMKKFGNRMFFKGSDYENCAVAGIDDNIKATEFLAKTGCYILTTLGPNGLFVLQEERDLQYIPAYQPKEIVDETGAGDCFMATLMTQLGKKNVEEKGIKSIEEEIKMASAASSFLVEHKGPNGFRSKSEIMKRVRENRVMKAVEVYPIRKGK